MNNDRSAPSAALAFVAWLASGCVGAPAPDASSPETSVEAKLTALTRVITDDVHGALIDDADGVLRFDKSRIVEVGDIAVGDVVVSGVGEGFVRTVTGVRRGGGEIVLETRPAEITEAIDTARIATSAVVDGSDHNAPLGGLSPVETRTDHLGGAMDLSGTVLFEDNVGGLDVLLDIPEGHISFQPSVDVDIDIRRARLESLKAVATGELDAKISVRLKAEGAFAQSRETEIRSFRQRKVLTQWVGWVPVVEVITVRFYVGYEADVQGGVLVETGAHANGIVKAGAEYRRGGGTRSLTGTSSSFEGKRPEWSQWATGSVRAFIRPEIDVAVYGVAGPGVRVEPWVRLSGEQSASAAGANASWALDAGVRADVLFRMKLFGEGSTYERTVYDGERNIASGSWQLDAQPERDERTPERDERSPERDERTPERPREDRVHERDERDEDAVAASCVGRSVEPIGRYGALSGLLFGASLSAPTLCHGGQGPEAVYSMVFADTGEVCLEATAPMLQPSLYVRTACDDRRTEVACAGGVRGADSRFTLFVTEGVKYYAFVDGLTPLDWGEFTLNLTPGACPG